jgi:hypothetical protein
VARSNSARLLRPVATLAPACRCGGPGHPPGAPARPAVPARRPPRARFPSHALSRQASTPADTAPSWKEARQVDQRFRARRDTGTPAAVGAVEDIGATPPADVDAFSFCRLPTTVNPTAAISRLARAFARKPRGPCSPPASAINAERRQGARAVCSAGSDHRFQRADPLFAD